MDGRAVAFAVFVSSCALLVLLARSEMSAPPDKVVASGGELVVPAQRHAAEGALAISSLKNKPSSDGKPKLQQAEKNSELSRATLETDPRHPMLQVEQTDRRGEGPAYGSFSNANGGPPRIQFKDGAPLSEEVLAELKDELEFVRDGAEIYKAISSAKVVEIKTPPDVPRVEYSLVSTNCPALETLTVPVVLRISAAGKVIEIVDAFNSSEKIPASVFECEFIPYRENGIPTEFTTLYHPTAN